MTEFQFVGNFRTVSPTGMPPSTDIEQRIFEQQFPIFGGCSGLTSMTCLNPAPPRCIGMNASDVDYTIPLYVPEGSMLKYKAADYWRNFVIIREISNILFPTWEQLVFFSYFLPISVKKVVILHPKD